MISVLTGLLGVSALATTRSDYDESFNFSTLKTWDFKVQNRMPRDPVGTNNLWNERIRRYLGEELTADGFKKQSDGMPSFLVAYYMGTKERYDARYIDYGFPGVWGRWWRFGGWHGWGPGWGNVDVWQIPFTESTLVIDIIDPETNILIWRGYNTDVIDFNKSDKSIRDAVDDVMKRFVHDVKKNERE
jgi:hypothetical protein